MTKLPRTEVPCELSHYYDEETGPFRSLTHLPLAEAEGLAERLRVRGDTFAARRAPDYVRVRLELEERVRELFVARGGRPVTQRPHYLTLGPCPWLLSWYRAGRELRLPLSEVDPSEVSFTYGDLFPALRYVDGLEHSGRVYLAVELPELIGRFGLPQLVNPDGSLGPKRYIEAQLWREPPRGS